jgi:hypothetical protein
MIDGVLVTKTERPLEQLVRTGAQALNLGRVAASSHTKRQTSRVQLVYCSNVVCHGHDFSSSSIGKDWLNSAAHAGMDGGQ